MTMRAESVPPVRDFTLAEIEGVIESGLMTFFEVGAALAQIRERRLYRETHDTFEAYCQERWSFNRQRASQLIQASEMSRILDIQPARASHVEALLPLKSQPELAREVVAEVRTAKGDDATAADYKEAVAKKTGRQVRPAPKPSAATKRVAEPDLSQDIPDDLVTAGADVDPSYEFPSNNEPAVAPKTEQWCQTCGGKYRGAACPCAATVDDDAYPRVSDVPCRFCGGEIVLASEADDRALATGLAQRIDGGAFNPSCGDCLEGGADELTTSDSAVSLEAQPTAAATAPANGVRANAERSRDGWRPVRSAISDPTPARRTGMDGGSVIYVDATAGAITRALFSHGGGVVAIVDAIAEEAPAEQYVALVGLMSERLPIEQARALYRRLDTRIRVHNDQQTALHLTGKAS